MRRLLSKESLADFAQQAAGALRRMVSSSDGWNSRDALSSSSQIVVAACRTNTKLDIPTLDAWVDDLVRELEMQSTNANTAPATKESAAETATAVPAAASSSTEPSLPSDKTKNDAWRPLSESALMANLEVARVLMCSVNASEAGAAYHAKRLVFALVQFYQCPTLSQKLRDCCALVVVGVCSSHSPLLRDCLLACQDTLRAAAPDSTGRVLRVLLASLLVEVLHQFHILGHGDGAKEELGDRGTTYLKSLMDCLFQAACQVLQEPSPVPTSGVMSPMTVALGKAEGDAAGKATAAAATSFPTERFSPSALPSAQAPPPPTPAASPNAPSAAPASASAVAVASDATATPAEAVSAEAAASTPPASTAAISAGACDNALTFTASVVLLSVVGGVYRGRADLKSYFVHTYGADYARLWVKLASQLPQMQTTLQLTAAPSRTTVTATLEPVEYWRSELLEMLVEVCTEKSFTNQRAIVMMTLTAAGNGSGSGGNSAAAAASAGASARRVAQRGTGSGPAAVLGGYQYDPIPPDWEVHLASGSAIVWQLASALYSCTVTAAGANLLTAVLLQLNTKYASAETLYRWVITTLTLLCVANPRNAVVLSEHGMLRTLVALINCNQPSVFPSSAEVTLWSCADGGDAHHTPAEANAATAEPAAGVAAALPQAVTQCLTPAQTLNVNTTQLTFCFLDTLTSTTFSKTAVAMLCKGIQDMYSVASSQTDVDVVENVLHGLGKAFIPHPILFFPGDGYVTRRLRQIFPRGSGYSFAAWIYPTCVWGGGSCLYSFMDQSDTRVSILIVADGRLCSLAVRVNKSGSDPLELVMGDGTFAASQWTHVVVTHGVALNVHVNGRKLESVHDVPYPKEKHSLTFTMGGAAQLPGFVGYASGMSVSPSLSEKDIARLCAAGPTLYEPTKDCAALLAPCFEEESGSENPSTASGSTLQRHEVMAKHPAEFTWHNVELHTPTDIEEVILPRCVIEWVLTVLQAREKAAVQSISTAMNVSKLCISFLSTSMQLASSEELTAVVRKKHLERLRREVLSWKTTFPEFASLLLQSVAVRGGGRVLRQHACTQSVFDILLSCVMQTSARNKELMEGSAGMSDGSALQSSPTGASSPQLPASPPPQAVGGTQSPLSSASPLPSIDTHQANATNIILRELSDCLLVKENLRQFQEDPRRFQKILNSTLYLPNECIKSVVILIEKLCRGEAELRQVFLFLFTPSSLSPTADTAKVRVLRMLFDIAQEDVAMCEMIQECCKGRGFAFLLLLVNGENHCSEAIRVLAVGLLSLLLPLKSCAKFFKKNDGFDILSMAITEPRSPIPLGIRTFDALIQVAFDEFRRRKEKKPEADSIAMRLMAAAHLAHRSRQRESTATAPTLAAASVASGSAAGAGRPARRTFEYRGYTPSIAVNQLGTRRGYSFEHTHDYGRVSEDFGELMILHKGSRYHSLELPLALKTVMCALDALIHTLVRRLPAASLGSNASNAKRVPSGEPPFMSSIPMAGGAGVSDYPTSPLPRQESGQLLVTGGGGGAAAYPSNSDERVVVEVLNYLSKVIDYPKHALKLMDIQWLGGLWQAVRVFFERPPDVSATSAASASPAATVSGSVAAMERELYEVGVRRLHQDRSDFVAEVRQRTCTIIRKMVILDISSNERAQVRSIRDGDYPPRLVRIVLEEIARYFCVQKNGELTENASNIIRNLNSIFKEVQTALHPFPPSLGVAIVMAITNISVSSSMQVRRRMKTSSNLLTMRDNLAFFVLRESRRFLRLRKRSLNQLVDINVNNANSMTVLLFHLSNSITENNVNEVEILVPLIQQLAGADSARLRELHSVVGEHRDVIELKDLLSSSSNGIGGGGVLSPLQPSAYSSIPTPSDRAMSEAFTDVDSNAGGAAGGTGNGDRPHWNGGHGLGLNPLEDDSEPSPGAFTVQLLEWCRANPEAWATVQRNVQAAMANLALDKRDEKKEERSTFFGVSSGCPQTPKAGSGSGGGGSGSTNGGGGGSSSGGAAGVGYSERSRREFQQLRVEVEEEVARSTGASAAMATPSGSVGH